MIVISVSGRAGAGKDTFANTLIEEFARDGIKAKRVSFAGPLKDVCTTMFGWNRAQLESDPFYKEGGLGGWVPKSNPGAKPVEADRFGAVYMTESDGEMILLDTDPACVRLGMTRRVIMQRIGTECMRQGLHQNIWIILMDLAFQRGDYSDIDVGIIADARFENELDYTQTTGGFSILIERTDDQATLTQHVGHASETEWRKWGDRNGWAIRYENNPSRGIDRLRKDVVDTVYTEIVRRGISRFSNPVQHRLIERSWFGKNLLDRKMAMADSPKAGFPDVFDVEDVFTPLRRTVFKLD